MKNLALDQASAKVDGVGYGVIDESGKIRTATLGLAKLLNANRRSLEGASIFTVLSPSCRSAVEERLRDHGIETRTTMIEYLVEGSQFAKARFVSVPFSSGRLQQCFAFVIQDPHRCGSLDD